LANNQPKQGAKVLLNQKTALIKDILAATEEQLLLVDLEGLGPILSRKEALMEQIRVLDEKLAGMAETSGQAWEAEPRHREIAELIEGILENERTLEARLTQEVSNVKKEIGELDQQTRFKRYLDRQRPKSRGINLKK